MRVLAIRGCNLTSLRDPFEVAFDRPPLNKAGVFAIAGPTAAGKSTILDALCLALFDEVPRLKSASKHRIGKDEISASDVRSLLSPGAGHGYAEVEFEGRDGKAYVARWEVRRAHRRATGTLQAQTVSLVDGTTRLGLGGTKTQTLQAIQERIGLTFDQFCRSALLAQGDFAAFLRAGPQERAALLEQVTGMQLYTRLSIAAHVKAREVTSQVDQLHAAESALTLLSAEDRATTEAKRAAAGATVQDARKRLARMEAALRWHEQRAMALRQVQDAEARLAASVADRAAADVDRDELERVEAAQALRPLLEAEQFQAGEAERAEQARDVARAEAERAARRAETLRAEASVVDDRVRQAEEELRRTKPAIEDARRVDHELELATQALPRLRAERQQRAKASEEARAAVAKIKADVDRTSEGLQSATEWLARHEVDFALARDWERWRRLLERARHASEEIRRIEHLHGDADAAQEQAAEGLQKARQGEAAAQDHHSKCEAAALEADTAAARAAAKAPRERRAGLLDCRDALQSLLRITQGAVDQHHSAQEARADEGQSRTAQETARERARAARERCSALELQRAQVDRTVSHLRAQLSLAERRGELEPGQPCPLCGSSEHPWATGAPIVDSVLAEAENEAKSMDGELRAAVMAVTAAEEQCRAAAKDETQARARAEKHEVDLGELEKRWQDGVAALPADASVSPDGLLSGQAEAAIQARLVETAGALVAATADEEAAERLRDLATTAHRDVEASRRAVMEAERVRSAAEREHGSAVRIVEGFQADRVRVDWELRAMLEELAPALAEDAATIRDALSTDKDGVAAKAQARASAYKSREEAQAQAERTLAKLESELLAAQERVSSCVAEDERSAADLAEAEQAHEALAVRRSLMLGGHMTTRVEEELENSVSEARQTLDRLRGEAAAASAQVLAGTTAAHLAEGTLADRQQAQATATTALEKALSAAGWTRARLSGLLEHAAGWVREQRQRVEQLDREVAKATSVLTDRRLQLMAQEDGAAPHVTADEAGVEREAALKELTVAEHDLAEATFTLRRDDEEQQKAASLARDAEERRKAAQVWQRLGSLIGSADGKKLRVFAQGLTFDALVRHANEHMKALRPRYRLARVPGEDLDFQVVDHEHADEVRSVSGLSGGETFLVSLALALGLSSLSSRDAQVKSLFIDEGFGTLDQETLAVALSALDALQASGRQVGVISHLVGFSEQIGAQVRVEKLGGGRSRVVIAGAEPPGGVREGEGPLPPLRRRRRGRKP